MRCANHPDIEAMASCQQCEKSLCAMCVYFRDGVALCAEHYAAAGGTLAPGELARPKHITRPLSGDEAEVPEPTEQPITGEPANRPAETDAPTVQFSAPSANVWQQTPQHWTESPRLEPMPMNLRPGWSEEPLVKPPGNGDTLGLAGLIISIAGLPASFCCGFGAPFGLILGLLGGGLSIAALVTAAQSRNPQQARITGGIGIGAAALTILAGICVTAALFGMLSS